MEYNLILIFSIMLNIGLILMLIGQKIELNSLRNNHQTQFSDKQDEDLIRLAKIQINSLGRIDTVKYLREQKGLTLIKAKQIVDRIEE